MVSLKISIVTPSYNQGQYIKDTIESVLYQTYKNFEHIILDSRSTDNTVEILKEFKHLKWVSEIDKGQADAINKGFKKAEGDIFCYINSDDMLLPNTLEFVADYFSKNKNVDLIYGNCILIDSKGSIIKIRKSEEFNLNRLLYLGYSYIQQPSTFFRREVFEDVGYFDENLKYVMDYDYWLRVAKSGKLLKYVNRELSLMRVHREAKTFVDNKEMFKEAFSVSKKYGGDRLIRYHFHYFFWYILNSVPGLFKFLFNLRSKKRIR